MIRFMERFDLICLGCGPAGEKAATQAAYFGRRVAIVEREPQPGGAMVNTGTIPSKALRETALLCSAFRRRPVPGLSLDIRREVSLPGFIAHKLLVQQQEHDRIEQSIDRHGITVIRGVARLAGPHAVEVEQPDGSITRLKSDYILIATGSSPHQPDFLPFDHPSVVDADGVLELERMPRSLAIVGGGVIGCEYACVFAEMGVKVSLFEPRDKLLPFLDDECRSMLYDAMASVDIDLQLNTTVEKAEVAGPNSVRVFPTPGEAFEADVLLWAAGRSGNTQDIGLETIGVEANKRGYLTVNEHYQTSAPSVYAAGDVVGYPALASTSMEQGRVAACHMFGMRFKRSVASLFPMGIYTIPPIAMIGLSEDQALEQGRKVIVGRAPYRQNARGRMLGDAEGMLKAVFDRRTHALLGAQVIGAQATELIHFAHPLIVQELGIEYLIDTCFNYPSLTELFKYAAYHALQQIAAEDRSIESQAA